MNPINQYLSECRVEDTSTMARKVKLASVLGAMTREELAELDDAVEHRVPVEKTASDETSLTKVAFIASVGAGQEITPQMIRDGVIKQAALGTYIMRGLGTLKNLVMGGGKLSRMGQLKRLGSNIATSYGKGAAQNANWLGKLVGGTTNAIRRNPALGVGLGTVGLGAGGIGLLRRQPNPDVTVNNY